MLKGVLYYNLENATQQMAPRIRAAGQNLFRSGNALQGQYAHQDSIVPSLRCVPISDSKYPRTLLSDWVAPNATVIGDVKVESGASLWHGVTIRGDTA